MRRPARSSAPSARRAISRICTRCGCAARSPVEVGYLLHCSAPAASSALACFGVPCRPTSVPNARAWRQLLAESWRTRRQGEAFPDFCRRLMQTHGPFRPDNARQVLRRLGLIKRRRGRPRKARASRAAA